MRCSNSTPDVLTDFRICKPIISLKENFCAGDILCSVFARPDKLFEFTALLIREIDEVLLSARSCRYELRGYNLAVYTWDGTS